MEENVFNTPLNRSIQVCSHNIGYFVHFPPWNFLTLCFLFANGGLMWVFCVHGKQLGIEIPLFCHHCSHCNNYHNFHHCHHCHNCPPCHHCHFCHIFTIAVTVMIIIIISIIITIFISIFSSISHIRPTILTIIQRFINVSKPRNLVY